MKKVAIFGAGGYGEKIWAFLQGNEEYEIVCFFDNDEKKQGHTFCGFRIVKPQDYNTVSSDIIVIAIGDYVDRMSVYRQLESMGIPISKLQMPYELIGIAHALDYPRGIAHALGNSRVQWLRAFANWSYAEGITGNTAEVGVFRGDFAGYMNEYFYDRMIYLFDPFDIADFHSDDLDSEPMLSEFFKEKLHNFANCSVEVVMSKMAHPEKCIIKQGWFPESAEGIDDVFCFVNLDADLYRPTLEALRFFWDKITPGGGILVHDYFYNNNSKIRFPGVKQAVDDFEAECCVKLPRTVIGDYCSIFIVKT